MVPTTNPELAGAPSRTDGGRHRRAPQPLGRRLLAVCFELSGYLGRTVSAVVALAVIGSIAAVQAPQQHQEAAGQQPATTHSAAEIASHRVR